MQCLHDYKHAHEVQSLQELEAMYVALTSRLPQCLLHELKSLGTK